MLNNLQMPPPPYYKKKFIHFSAPFVKQKLIVKHFVLAKGLGFFLKKSVFKKG